MGEIGVPAAVKMLAVLVEIDKAIVVVVVALVAEWLSCLYPTPKKAGGAHTAGIKRCWCTLLLHGRICPGLSDAQDRVPGAR